MPKLIPVLAAVLPRRCAAGRAPCASHGVAAGWVWGAAI